MLTQTLLSAKHLLETKIIVTKWNKEFDQLFEIDINSISLISDLEDSIPDLRKYTMIIDPDDVNLVNDEEDTVKYDDDGNKIDAEDSITYNEYITHFYIKYPNGNMVKFGSESDESLYISNELNSIIRRKAKNDDNKVNIPLDSLQDEPLFYIKINNSEISKTMDGIINILNKSDITGNMTKDEALQSIVDLVIEGNLDVDAIHLEVILANQIVSKDDILRKPNWNDPNAQYRILTLNQALTNNPSVIVSLLYKDLNKVLYNPLTFTKNAPSFFDLFFHEQPQVYMQEDILVDEEDVNIRDYAKTIDMVKIVDKNEAK
jgi:coenzyme F420-reducing hydrogenase alpha subunit